MNYFRGCPICGQELQANAHAPEIAPWRCDECRRSWWVAELTMEARQHFQLHRRDFGYQGTPGHEMVAAGVLAERVAANGRGVSVRRDQLGLVHRDVLAGLLARHPNIHSNFADEMKMQVEG